MNYAIFSTILLCTFILHDNVYCSRFGTCNVTEFHSRQKRYLVFPMTGGLFKMIMGIGIPVAVGHDRSLGFGYNMQFQYSIPPSLQSVMGLYTPVTFERKRRELTQRGDTSREYLYMFIEALLDIRGLNGRACLLRVICEAAEAPVMHDGLFGELVHAILTPTLDLRPVDEKLREYSEARTAGEAGADCRTLHPDCPAERNMMDAISMIDNLLHLNEATGDILNTITD